MQTLPAEYLAEIARQLSFSSAFLGGLATTFFVNLLITNNPEKYAGCSIACAASSACSFIVAVIAFVFRAIVLSPNVPILVGTQAAIDHTRVVSAPRFGLGIYSLLISVGVSGWIRSNRLGFITTSSSALSIVLVSWAFNGFA